MSNKETKIQNPHHDHHACDHHDHHDHHDNHHNHHEPHERHFRALIGSPEVEQLSDTSKEQLQEGIDKFLLEKLYGNAVILQEIQLKKISLDNRNEHTTAKYLLARTYCKIHEDQKSLELWNDVLHNLQHVTEPALKCEIIFEAGLAFLGLKDNLTAQKNFEKGLHLATKFDLKEWQANFEHEQGLLLLSSDPLASVALLSSALKTRQHLADKGLIIKSLLGLGQAFQNLQENLKAKNLFEEALDLASTDAEFNLEKKQLEEQLSQLRSSELRKKLEKFNF